MMRQAKPTIARPLQSNGQRSTRPAPSDRVEQGIATWDLLQIWTTRRLRMAYLSRSRSQGV